MNWYRNIVYSFLIGAALLVTGCESSEKRDLEKLTEEAERPIPETRTEGEKLQRQVKQLNKEIKKASQERIERINRQIEQEGQ